MRFCGTTVMIWIVVGIAAQQAPAQTFSDRTAIKALFDKQEADWNRGDLDTFATCYKNSPEILFVGAKKISRGYAEMLARYHTQYPNREAMGTLKFSDVQVQPLDGHFATATGKFHLARTAAGGGDASGSYMLVLEKTAQGWKIVRDVTMAAPNR